MRHFVGEKSGQVGEKSKAWLGLSMQVQCSEDSKRGSTVKLKPQEF